MQNCQMDFRVDPTVMNMDLETFRGFVNESCVPTFYETLARVRAKANLIDDVITDDVRSGEGRLSCSADSQGNVRCEGSVTIRW